MDTTDPSIVFDSEGISNHYWEYHKNIKQNWHNDSTGETQLENVVHSIRHSSRNREYDCLIGLSGGLDSSYMLHTMVTKYGLRPLVFHVDAGWNTETAVHNINVMIDKLKLDLFTEVINWNEMKEFQLSMFKSGVPHLDIPQDMAFVGTLYKYASKYSIKYILNGGNISTECTDVPLEYLYWGSDMKHVRDILKKTGAPSMPTYPFSSIWQNKLISRFVRGVKVFKPLNFLPYTKKLAISELVQVYDWKPYPQKHFESRFTRFFEGYWLPTRFGFDMRRREYSSLILTNQMTRSVALSLLQKPALDTALCHQEFSYVASKLDISERELEGYLLMPKRFYWDYKNSHRLFTIGQSALNLFTSSRRGGAY